MNIAIIGLGQQGMRHLEAAQAISGLRVVALCDPVDDALDQAAGLAPNADRFSRHEDMLHGRELDAVFVATTASSHTDIVVAACQAGIGRVFCEKPISTSLEEADRMIRACEDARVRLLVNHGRRWFQAFERAIEIRDSGALGAVRHVHFACGGARLGAVGTHAFDGAACFAGSRAVLVQGCIERPAPPDPRGPDFDDPGGYGQISYANGSRATIELCADTSVPPSWTITMEDGRILLDDLTGACATCARQSGDDAGPRHGRHVARFVTTPWTVPPMDIVELTRSAMRNLLSDDELRCDGSAARAALEVAVAFHAQEKRGAHGIRLPLEGEDAAIEVACA